MDLSNIIISGISPEIWNVKVDAGETNHIVCRKFYGLTFCEKGRLYYTYEGKDYLSDPNHVIILPKGRTYSLRGVESGMFPVINFFCTEALYDNEFHSFYVDNPRSLINDFVQLQHLLLFNDSVSHVKSMILLYEMFSYLIKNDITSVGYRAISPAIQYLEDHVSDPLLSVEGLAERVGLSVAYFRNLFVSIYGVSPRKYIQEIRINKAKMLLRSSMLSVSEISRACGFASVNHFCRSFKNSVGCTASEYEHQYGLQGSQFL